MEKLKNISFKAASTHAKETVSHAAGTQKSNGAAKVGSTHDGNFYSVTVTDGSAKKFDLEENSQKYKAEDKSIKDFLGRVYFGTNNLTGVAKGDLDYLMRGFVDNNRDTAMPLINGQYLAEQILEDTKDIREARANDEAFDDKYEDIISKALDFTDKQEAQDFLSGLDSELSSFGITGDDLSSFKSSLEKIFRAQIDDYSQISPGEKYETFDEDADVNKIPQKLMDGLYEESLDDGTQLFCPDANIFAGQSDGYDAFINDLQYIPNQETVNFDDILAKDWTGKEDQKLLAINKRIAEAYDLPNLDNKAGGAILHAIGLEEENNFIFDGQEENLNEYISLIEQKLSENGGELTLPDVSISFINKYNLSESQARVALKNRVDSYGDMAYLGVNQNSLKLSDSTNTPVEMKQILKCVNFQGGNLYDAYESGDPKAISLAASAIQQIIENNPQMQIALNDYFTGEKITPKPEDLLNLDLTQLLKGQAPEDENYRWDGTINLEDIAYMAESELHVYHKAPASSGGGGGGAPSGGGSEPSGGGGGGGNDSYCPPLPEISW